MAEATEPSILEYARFHGVASSHYPSSDLLDYISTDDLESIPQDLSEEDCDLQSTLSSAGTKAKVKENERLEIGRDGAILLSSIIKPALPLSRPSYTPSHLLHRVRNMKLSLPILRSDHDLDMLAFDSSPISLDPSELNLPLDKLERENDESLEWPDYCLDFPMQLWEGARREKLDCAREVLVFIQGIRGVPCWEGGEVERFKMQKKVIEPLTPPLLPLEPEIGPFVPFSPVGRLQMLSEPDTPPVKEHLECEREVEEMDFMGIDDGESAEQMVAEYVELDEQDSQTHVGVQELSVQKRVRGEDLMVEGPITPPISAKKRRMKEDGKPVGEILADNVPELLEDFDDMDDSGNILDEHLVEIAQAAMEKVEERLQNERLRQVGPKAQVPVPTLDPTTIIPPWKAAERFAELVSNDTTERRFIGSTVEDYLEGTTSPMDVKVERGLEWVPFSLRRSYVSVDERIEGDGGLDLVESPNMEEWESVAGLLTKLSGLRILGGDDDFVGEDLLPVDSLPETRLSSPIVEEALTSTEVTKRGAEKQTGPPKEELKTREVKVKGSNILDKNLRGVKRASQLARPGESLFQSGFSTAGFLSNFMEVRGHGEKRRKLEISPYFSPDELDVIPEEPPEPIHSERPDNPPTDSVVEFVPALPLPFPDILSPSERLTLVLSTALLKTHRFVIHHLESMSPQHTLIFRDYTRFNQTNQQSQRMRMQTSTSPTSRAMAEEEEDLSHEADIILSPSAAILLTTSQDTTQLYLPGHSPRNGGRGSFDSPLRERIARTCVRYEQLYVLLCHSSGPFHTVNTTGSKPECAGHTPLIMDNRTVDSIRSLVSFCSSLSLLSTVTPLIVPSQPPETMKWIMALAYKHKHTFQTLAIPEEHQEETPSELFLRRAGLNPLAAYYIMHEKGMGGDEEGGGNSGVAKFIAMDPRERRRRFAPVIGERLLARVDGRLEMRWDFV
ncbi:hypothetical protein FQN54_006678 [Arachnomyces sp. PD_36]|nr:hypothetical protein FQN54_006678 [Arachnomyces sp. PD_36]